MEQTSALRGIVRSPSSTLRDTDLHGHAEGRHVRVSAGIYAAVALACVLCLPAGGVALTQLVRHLRFAAAGRIDDAEVARLKARFWVRVAIVVAVSVIVIGFVAAIFLANNMAVVRDFFDVKLIAESMPLILRGFWLNVQLFIIAEILTLAWALIVAVIRGLPGRLAAPVRLLATVYVDVFRGLPVLLVILIVVFGLRRTGLPIVSGFSDFWLVVLAIVLAHGAYLAETIKGAIDGIHPSQVAAARSLGLTYGQTMRYVVIPPAMRSIVPPLLNGFISLQKETSLVSFVGLLDAVSFATTLSIQNANMSALTGAALCFLVITIPMTRLADRLLKKDRQRTQGGAPA